MEKRILRQTLDDLINEMNKIDDILRRCMWKVLSAESITSCNLFKINKNNNNKKSPCNKNVLNERKSLA